MWRFQIQGSLFAGPMVRMIVVGSLQWYILIYGNDQIVKVLQIVMTPTPEPSTALHSLTLLGPLGFRA